MPAPFEIVAGLLDAYLAPVGTAFPAINAAPAGAWIKLGAGGAKDYRPDDGVVVRWEESVDEEKSLGTTGPRKAFRTDEGLMIELTLIDFTAESLQAALNQNAITTLAGPPAEKTIQLLNGPVVATRALLVRGVLSPYVDTANYLQFDIPLVYQRGSLDMAFKKAPAVGLKLQFRGLQDDNLGFGKIHLPTA
jgi:hypothetical protein